MHFDPFHAKEPSVQIFFNVFATAHRCRVRQLFSDATQSPCQWTYSSGFRLAFSRYECRSSATDTLVSREPISPLDVPGAGAALDVSLPAAALSMRYIVECWLMPMSDMARVLILGLGPPLTSRLLGWACGREEPLCI